MGQTGADRGCDGAVTRLTTKTPGGKPWLWTLLGWLTLCGVSCDRPPASGPNPPDPAASHLGLAVPDRGAYTGAYIDFGEQEDAVTLDGIEEFERLTGKHQAIIAFSSYWGEQNFPTAAAQIVTEYGSVPLIYWSPWDRPYREDLIILKGPDKFNLESILEGQWDAYIDQWADGAKALGKPLLVSLCNEMNGNWFPWSGSFYGGSRPIAGSVPQRYVGPAYFKRAYRYIVDRVRARGAANVLWVFHVNNFAEPYDATNTMALYYPGPAYVDWLGLSVYGKLFPEGDWDEFEDMVDKPYAELAAVDQTKPMMLAEWGVGEFPATGNKAEWIANALTTIEESFPRIHAAVYWHERWQNSNTFLYSNLRVNSSPQALDAYRKGVARPFWIDRPTYR